MSQDDQMKTDFERVTAFLLDPATYGQAGPVKRIGTHAALVFLTGAKAYKIKKPVKFPFLDYSTRELRRQAITRELVVNQPNAPTIYRGVRVVVRMPGDQFALVAPDAVPPDSEPLEWVLEMARFDEAATLDHLAARSMEPGLIDELANVVVAAESRAPVRGANEWIDDLRSYIQQNDDAFRAMPAIFPSAEIQMLTSLAEARFSTIASLLAERGERGFVRLTHGDLHTGNIAIVDGRPVLFDAIEFDDRIATGDILYDAAFLIMDLDERGRGIEANRLLNGWLMATARTAGPGEPFSEALQEQARGLDALPFFLMMRAAIRAKVTAAKAAYLSGEARSEAFSEAQRYFHLALLDLERASPRLIAIGGLSGTGKSTLARQLAPLVGHRPGAIHLRSDQIRKSLVGVGELDRLPPDSYTPEASRRVYEVLRATASAALSAGWSVVVDTVAARPEERAAFAELARVSGADFTGIWLEAPQDILLARVAQRSNDASDADARVVALQGAYALGGMDWIRIDASGTEQTTFQKARTALGLKESGSP